MHSRLLFVAFLLASAAAVAQLAAFRGANGKWGLRREATVVTPATYDTIYGLIPNGRVCIACNRIRKVTNKLIKVTSVSEACNYLSEKGERLVIKAGKDTCSVFSLSRNSVQLKDNRQEFPVTCHSKKYLVNRQFRQLTFKPYHDIDSSADESLLVVQQLNDFDLPLTGVVNRKEEQIIPCRYSSLHVNPADSLIITCSAGLGQNAEDGVHDYQGRKIYSSRRHIDVATKTFLVERVFEPEEKFFVIDLRSKKESQLEAEDVRYHGEDQVLVRSRKSWYVYDVNTGKRNNKPYTP